MLWVLRQRDFALLWFGGLISMIGSWMQFVALPVIVYQLSGSALATGGMVIATRVPSVLLGAIAGVFVDRWDRKRTMVYSNLARAPILLLLFAVDSVDRLWIVYIVAFASATASQFFGPAENALLPTLVGKDHLVPANSLNALNNNLSRLIGPAVGGVIAAWAGLGGIAITNAATSLVAAGMIALIVASGRPAREQSLDRTLVTGAWVSLWRDWLAGVRVIRGSKLLMVVFGVIAISSVGEGIMGTAFWVYVDQALDGGTREAGWLVSAQAVGGIFGAMVIGTFARTRSPARLLGWGAIGIGLIDLLIFNYPAFISGIWLGIVLFVIVGVPVTAFSTGFTTAIQTEVEDAYRGRVFGSLNTTMALLTIVGAGIAGFATERFGAVAVLTVDSLAYVASGIFALMVVGATSAAVLTKKASEAA